MDDNRELKFNVLFSSIYFDMSVLFTRDNQLAKLVAYFTNFYKYNNGNNRKEMIDRIANLLII